MLQRALFYSIHYNTSLPHSHRLPLSPPRSLNLSPSLSQSLPLALSISPPRSLNLSPSLSQSLLVALSISPPRSLNLSPSLSQSLPLTLSISISLSQSLPLTISFSPPSLSHPHTLPIFPQYPPSDVNQSDRHGHGPLHLIASSGPSIHATKMVSLLLQHGSNTGI